MNHLKLFEEYKEDVHKVINMHRDARKSPTYKKIVNILSFIDDILHLDFKNIKNTYKNRKGYEITRELGGELVDVLTIMKKDPREQEVGYFYDFDRYGVNAKLILDYLEDEDFKKYIDIDRRGFKSIEKYNDTIQLLRNYMEWKNGNYNV